MKVNNTVFWLFVILFALGLTFIIEGITLNVVGVIGNDASYLFEGALLIFVGSMSLSTSLYSLFKPSKESK